MKKQEFLDLARSRVVVLDGATGTELMQRGLPADACPEQWVLQHPEHLRDLQHAYHDAGSDIVYTCTFGANRERLKHYGIDANLRDMNRDLAKISREAVDGGLVFGDIGPSGLFIAPLGDMSFADAVTAKKEQAQGLLDGGVDGFVVETMMDIQEARASIVAIRDLCDLPIMASITLDHHGRCLTGADLLVTVVTLQAMGADAIGCNCSTGPADMIAHIRDVKPYARVPLLVKPNAGMPKDTESGTQFDMGPEEFAGYVAEFIRRGTNLLGGCCGTSPEYIRQVKAAAEQATPVPPADDVPSVLTSTRAAVEIARDRPLTIIGERINPTGKKALQAELRDGTMDQVREMAADQVGRGANLLDVNVSAPGVNESDVMAEAVTTLTQLTHAPLCIDTTDAEVLEIALQLYPGRALVNSISAEGPRLEENLPIAAKYGAQLIVMPMSDDGMPMDLDSRIRAVETVARAAADLGYGPRDLAVDGMLLACSSDNAAPAKCLDLIEWSDRTLGANTVVGLSNVSFGLPGREWINSGFLAMAVARGLSMAIANPTNRLVMAAKYTADLLNGRDEYGMEYIRFYRAVLHTHKVVERGTTADYEAIYTPEDGVVPQIEDIDEDGIEETLARRVYAD
ncbi:MAG: dihydropteroate synthase [Planctomycetes bacterium]|jgi:5-methyltetrahydrofolate--homocysteine methyltransferase|nr:dihydropteroate synthase [Planctomycetota bacterium]